LADRRLQKIKKNAAANVVLNFFFTLVAGQGLIEGASSGTAAASLALLTQPAPFSDQHSAEQQSYCQRAGGCRSSSS
jgi:hypothetical protein